MKSLDTNIILRFLLRDVPDQSAMAEALIANSQCYVTDVVVTETVFVLEKVYDAPRGDIADSVKKFLGFPNVISSEDLLEEAMDLYAARPSLSIVDCYSAVEALLSGNQLVTFDKKLLRHGGAQVVLP